MNARTPSLLISSMAIYLWGWTSVSAEPPLGYYDAAEGKIGPALRQALHSIISPHRVVPYAGTSATNTATALMVLDEDSANTNHVILIYSRRSEPKLTFGQPVGWNREHLWPNSYGIDSHVPPYSDLFRLGNVPTAAYNLACYACQLGNLETALEWLRKAFQIGGKEYKLMALEDRDLEPLWKQIEAI